MCEVYYIVCIHLHVDALVYLKQTTLTSIYPVIPRSTTHGENRKAPRHLVNDFYNLSTLPITGYIKIRNQPTKATVRYIRALVISKRPVSSN